MANEQKMSYEEFLAMRDSQCGADFSTGGADPCGTSCDLPRGHYPETDHEGDDLFGGDGRVSWRGGGMCAGDPVPATNVHYMIH